MKKDYANYLLNKTLEDYNLIAYDFSSKRAYISQDILDLQKFSSKGNRILDLGCGNGRLSEIFENSGIEYIGVDISEKLIKIARSKYPNKSFQVVEFFKLLFPDNYFDKVYCLSVLHHIPSLEYRKKFLLEAKRVLKPHGLIILTVWNLLIKPSIISSIVSNSLAKLFHKSQLDYKDIFLPFKRSSDINLTDRYIHCFSRRELTKLLRKCNFNVLESGYQKRGQKVKNENIYTIAKK
ncbi:MAG: class I SAM-dependent methyltransferase [bacterium]|nr:class I SAM-dependent methyltransferase [bacterium]